MRQQRVLSAAGFFYLAWSDQVRSAIDLPYTDCLCDCTSFVDAAISDDLGEAEVGVIISNEIWDADMADDKWPPCSFEVAFPRSPQRKRALRHGVRDAVAYATEQRDENRCTPTKKKSRPKQRSKKRTS